MIRGDSMDIGIKLPPELEQATRKMIGDAITAVVRETQQANNFPEYMNQRQAAKYLGTSPGTIIRWEKANIGFPTIMIEGSKHYKKSSLDKWMNKQAHKN